MRIAVALSFLVYVPHLSRNLLMDQHGLLSLTRVHHSEEMDLESAGAQSSPV